MKLLLRLKGLTESNDGIEHPSSEHSIQPKAGQRYWPHQSEEEQQIHEIDVVQQQRLELARGALRQERHIITRLDSWWRHFSHDFPLDSIAFIAHF